MTRHAARYLLPLLAALSLALTGCSDNTPDSIPAHSSTTPASDAVDSGPRWKLLADELDGSLEPGAYGLTANGVSDHVAVIQAPEGYQKAYGGWTFVTGRPFRAMGFVTAARVPPDPCGSRGQDKFDAAVDPGPSVRDLAQALVAQEGAVTSQPTAVTVDGHHGLYLTYQVGEHIDVLACEARTFDIFSTGPASWWLEASHERAAIWILDVDGERDVLAWVAVPGVPRAQMQEMTRMVQSARFVER